MLSLSDDSSTDKASPGAEVDEVARHADSRFPPDGEMRAWREGPVVICRARGPFNAEFMRAYARMWAAHSGDWVDADLQVIHTVWAGSMLTSPDGLQVFGALMERAAQQLPQHTLHLWTAEADVEARSLMLPIWHGILRKLGLQSQDCYSEQEAAQIIAARLARPRG